MSTRPGGASNKQRSSTRPLDAPQSLLGRVLSGNYRLDRVINAGGMGIIFEARQLSVDRPVAIKLLKPTLSGDSDLMQRFSQEVEIGKDLWHPNVVSLLDAGRDASGLVYLVMEFFDGETFRSALQRKELSLIEILEVFSQACNALIEAHGNQVIHRDLKFDNIMLKRHRDGAIHVKLLDFGVAKMLDRDVDLTRGGQIPGTPGIIAPELIEMQAPSAQSDLYSLGVLLFTVLAGDAPFHGHNDLELMRAHKQNPLPRLETMVQDYVPEGLVELAYEMLAKDPSHRPRDAWIVRDRFTSIRAELLRKYRDMPRYIPPNAPPEELERDIGVLDPFSGVLSGVHEAFDDERVSARVPSSESQEVPLIVPTSVVSVLVFILIVLIVIIIVLLYPILGNSTP